MANDYGPSFRTDKFGRMKSWGGAASVEIEDAPDITIPSQTIRRARRVDPLLRAIGGTERRVTKWPDWKRRLYAAAERLRDDSALASGASAGNDLSGVRAGGTRTDYPAAQLDAIRRVRLVWGAMTLMQRDLIRFVVIGQSTLTQFETARHVRHGGAAGGLLVALGVLAGHYER